MFCADPVSPSQTTVQQTRRPAMKVHDGIEAPGEQPRRKGPLVRSTQDFIDIGIGVKAIHESRFHENRDAECRKLRLQRADGGRKQQAIPHGTKTNEKDTGSRRKALKQDYSQHRAHRPNPFGTRLRRHITIAPSSHASSSLFASLTSITAMPSQLDYTRRHSPHFKPSPLS